MSAISLTPPIFIYKINGKKTINWNGLPMPIKKYYARFMHDQLTALDDREDELIVEAKKFKYWKDDPGFDNE